jgi:hypothetical protein
VLNWIGFTAIAHLGHRANSGRSSGCHWLSASATVLATVACGGVPRVATAVTASAGGTSGTQAGRPTVGRRAGSGDPRPTVIGLGSLRNEPKILKRSSELGWVYGNRAPGSPSQFRAVFWVPLAICQCDGPCDCRQRRGPTCCHSRHGLHWWNPCDQAGRPPVGPRAGSGDPRPTVCGWGSLRNEPIPRERTAGWNWVYGESLTSSPKRLGAVCQVVLAVARP